MMGPHRVGTARITVVDNLYRWELVILDQQRVTATCVASGTGRDDHVLIAIDERVIHNREREGDRASASGNGHCRRDRAGGRIIRAERNDQITHRLGAAADDAAHSGSIFADDLIAQLHHQRRGRLRDLFDPYRISHHILIGLCGGPECDRELTTGHIDRIERVPQVPSGVVLARGVLLVDRDGREHVAARVEHGKRGVGCVVVVVVDVAPGAHYVVGPLIEARKGPARLVRVAAVPQAVVVAVVGRGDLRVTLIGKAALGEACLAIVDDGRKGRFIVGNFE